MTRVLQFRYIWCVFLWFPVEAGALQCATDPLAVFTELGGDPNDKEVHVRADNSEGDYLRADFSGSVEMHQATSTCLRPNSPTATKKARPTSTVAASSPRRRQRLRASRAHYDSGAQTASF